jgi:hypothetical protein
VKDTWEDNVTMSCKGTVCNSVKWNYLTQERYQWQVFASTEMKLRTTKEARNAEQLL